MVQRSAAFTVAGSDDAALLTIQDVAALLRVPVTWVYDRVRRSARDRIPGFKLGKYWRFRRPEVLAWVDARKVS